MSSPLKADKKKKKKNSMIYKLTDWLVTLRLTPKTSLGIPTIRGKTIRVSLLSKREMVVVWLSETEQAGKFNGKFTDVPLLEKSAPPMSDIHVSNAVVIKMMKGLVPQRLWDQMNFILESLKNLR